MTRGIVENQLRPAGAVRGPGRPRKPKSVVEAFVLEVHEMWLQVEPDDAVHWPTDRWRNDVVGFARDVLGVELCAPQIRIARAVQEHPRVACASGHRIGKSTVAAVIALWFFCSFEDARCIFSSTTDRQVNGVLWREVKRLWRRARVPMGGTLCEQARSGLKEDLREIVGYTASEAEAFQGFAGANLLFVMDEASGIDDGIFEALAGNRAGGARVLLLGNPTRTSGEFFEAFNAKAQFYHAFQVSSEESPNVIAGRVVVPGLATREWVEEMRLEHGETSAIYQVRVKGRFAIGEDGKIISLATIIEGQDRWDPHAAIGELTIGLDPAGDGLQGDETAMCAARGDQALRIYAWKSLAVPAIVVNLIGVIAEHRQNREHVRVNVDATGDIGDRVVRALRDYQDSHGDDSWLTILPIRAGDPNPRDPRNYPTMRDALWANGAIWLKEGGGIPNDGKLEKELHCASWAELVNGAAKVTPKDKMRKELGRSPDRADALLLALWRHRGMGGGRHSGFERQLEEPAAQGLSPYDGGFDPYG